MHPDATRPTPGQTPPLSPQTLEAGSPHSTYPSSVQNASQSNVEEPKAAKQEFVHILLLSAAFMSSINLVTNNISSEYSSLIHLTFSSTVLCSLGQVFGERLVAYVALVAATILSLIDIYSGGNVFVFVSAVIATSLGGMVLLLANAIHNANTSWNEEVRVHGSKLFITANILLKALFDRKVTPMSEDSGPDVMDELHRFFFFESFILLAMPVILHASGVSILSPIRRASFSLAPNNRAAIMSSVLFWAGITTSVAYLITTAMLALAETPIIIQIAVAVCAFCTAAILFKAPTNREDR